MLATKKWASFSQLNLFTLYNMAFLRVDCSILFLSHRVERDDGYEDVL